MEPKARDYTEGQINRIRMALNKYRIAAIRDGCMPSWTTVRDTIIYAEPNIARYRRDPKNSFHPERLRRFATGNQRLDVGKVADIFRFLLHAGHIREGELNENEADLQLFLALRQFIGNDDETARAFVAGLKRDYAIQSELSHRKIKSLHLRLDPDPSQLFLRVEEIVRLHAAPDEPVFRFRRDDDVRLDLTRTGYALPVTPGNVLHVFLGGPAPHLRLTYVQVTDARQGKSGDDIVLLRNGEDPADDLNWRERAELPEFANVFRFSPASPETALADAARGETEAKREQWQWGDTRHLKRPTYSAPTLPKDAQGSVLIGSARTGNSFYLDYALSQVGNNPIEVNRQDAEGMTALHHAAAIGARACVRMLVTSGLCDYLIRDKKGRTAADLAFEWSGDRAAAMLLAKKQARQAHKSGLGK